MFSSIWTEFAPPGISNLLSQNVNRKLFEKVVIRHFSIAPKEDQQKTLYAEEENAIRYIGGFVSHKLLCKYKKEQSGKAGQFVECLAEMGVKGPESSFYDYTQAWMNLVNRGGLFVMNDNCFLFFVL